MFSFKYSPSNVLLRLDLMGMWTNPMYLTIARKFGLPTCSSALYHVRKAALLDRHCHTAQHFKCVFGLRKYPYQCWATNRDQIFRYRKREPAWITKRDEPGSGAQNGLFFLCLALSPIWSRTCPLMALHFVSHVLRKVLFAPHLDYTKENSLWGCPQTFKNHHLKI